MRTRRIPETDLARIVGRPEDEQRLLLRDLKSFRPPHTLNPFRAVVPDIVNLQHNLLGETGRTPWSRIQESIEGSKEGEDGIGRNLAVAKALFDFAEEKKIVSYSKPVPRWNVGYGIDVAYWNQFYSVWDGRAAFVHFDPRLTHPLNEAARRFAFSLMHQRLRVDDPDFSEVELMIVRFGRGEGEKRTVTTHTASDIELYGYDQLNSMIDITYTLWIEELEARQVQARRASGGTNPFGF